MRDVQLLEQLRSMLKQNAPLEHAIAATGHNGELEELLSRIEKWCTEFALEQGVNNASTRAEVSSILSLTIKGFCKNYPNIIYQFDVVCDERNNPPAVIESGKLDYDILIKFAHGRGTFYLTRSVGIL